MTKQYDQKREYMVKLMDEIKAELEVHDKYGNGREQTDELGAMIHRLQHVKDTMALYNKIRRVENK